jgi:hypothetical protein
MLLAYCALTVSGSNPRHKKQGFDDAAAAAIAREGDPVGASAQRE